MPRIAFSAYKPFIIRQPLLPIVMFKKLSNGDEVSDDLLFNYFEDVLFKEALYLASPSLYYRIEKWISGDVKDKRQIDKLRFSLLKYITRATSRATPFGLFAGCGVGTFADKTEVTTYFPMRYKRVTSLDMVALDKIYFLVQKFPEVKRNILFFPNNSLYLSGKEYRYIKSMVEKGKREYFLTGTYNTSYLAELLKIAKKGVLIEDMILKLIEYDVSQEEAFEFIEQLISEQILVSELQLSLTGEDNLDILICATENLMQGHPIFNDLKDIKNDLQIINSNTGNFITQYEKVFECLDSIGIDLKKEHAIQTDLYHCYVNATLGPEIQQKIVSAFNIACKITDPKTEKSNLKKFIADFTKRYNEEELPLATVLDPDTGIGYGIKRSLEDVFIEGMESMAVKGNGERYKWSKRDDELLAVIYESLRENKSVVEIPDSLLSNADESGILTENDLPDTMSAIVEVVKVGGKDKIVFEGAGGSSAANLLARFSNGNKDIEKHIRRIVEDEKQMAKDYILAEIIHLPQSRTGNILRRPSVRDYEIPYGGHSFLHTENQIPIKDILISVRNNIILLKSKSLNKYIIPRLTNAHNYSRDALPVYHFLCDIQQQNRLTSIGFSFHPIVEKFPFLPRIEYGDVILSKARWRVSKDSIRNLLDYNSSDFIKLAVNWVKQLKLSKFVQLREGDNKLLINTENITYLKMLMETVKNKQSFILEEFLQSEPGLIQNEKGGYCNEVVVSFYNQSKLRFL